MEAQKQGVTVESVHRTAVTLERALDVVEQYARRCFFQRDGADECSVAIDEQLNAQLFGLKCAGEGTLGTLACGFIAPHLQRFNGRELSLTALPLGEIQLRDIRIAADRELRVTAEFGRPV
jgi:hypothetical protein